MKAELFRINPLTPFENEMRYNIQLGITIVFERFIKSLPKTLNESDCSLTRYSIAHLVPHHDFIALERDSLL